MAPKTLLGLALLALAGGLVAAVSLLAPAPPAAAASTHDVEVLGQGGRVVFRGPVEAANALEALEAAARAGGFAVEKTSYPQGTYVVAVDGERAEGSRGWVYEIRRGEALLFGDVAADSAALEAGDAVVWRWSDRPG